MRAQMTEVYRAWINGLTDRAGRARIQVRVDRLVHGNPSLHHQGLKDIAPSLRVAGYAPDGLVEAVELPDHPFGIGVQSPRMVDRSRAHAEFVQEVYRSSRAINFRV